MNTLPGDIICFLMHKLVLPDQRNYIRCSIWLNKMKYIVSKTENAFLKLFM